MCEVDREGGGRGEAGGRGRVSGVEAGVGSSRPTSRVRAAGALSAAPDASSWGKSGKESSSRGRGSRVEAGAAGKRAHPQPSPAT